MNDCLFCKIGNGEIPSYTIYEDEVCKAFLDIEPLTNGHILVIPKKHYINVIDADLDFVTHAFSIIKEDLYPLLQKKLNCQGLTICQNNKYGQEVKHLHFHLIPRYTDDEFKSHTNKDLLIDTKDLFEKITEK